MPTASIIVPSFNVARTLARTLTALLAQTYRDFEIIVVDDGSSDRTAEIAKAFSSDPRVRVVAQSNRGLAGARNTGIAAAKGTSWAFAMPTICGCLTSFRRMSDICRTTRA